MAKKVDKVALPKGFQQLAIDRVDGWFKLAKGNTLQGILEDSFQMKSRFNETGKKTVYKVRITSGETAVEITKEEDGVCGVDDVVGLDKKGFLKGLAKVAQGSEIFIRCTGKASPSKDYPQGSWRFDIGVAGPDAA
jgi:hypothetical protein